MDEFSKFIDFDEENKDNDFTFGQLLDKFPIGFAKLTKYINEYKERVGGLNGGK